MCCEFTPSVPISCEVWRHSRLRSRLLGDRRLRRGRGGIVRRRHLRHLQRHLAGSTRPCGARPPPRTARRPGSC